MFKSLRRPREFYKYLIALTAPIALQHLITFSLGLIDTFMVSQLGNKEMAAVTTANVPVFLLLSLGFGVQGGLGILVSQYWGKRDMKNISRAIGVALFIGTGIVLVLAILFALWPVQIMDLLSNEHELSVLGGPYLRIIGFSHVFGMISSVYISAQRSVENPNFGMKVLAFSTVLNTVLNYFLIYGKWVFPAMGIEGAALATLLARVAEVLICVIYALRDKHMPIDIRAMLSPGVEMVRRFVRYASPVVLNEAAWGFGNSLLTVILGYTSISVEFLAAYSVTGNLGRLFLVVCFGLGASTAVVIGKAIGEGQSHEEVMDLSRCLLLFSILVSAGIALIALLLIPIFFAPVVFPLFKLYDQSAAIAVALAVTAFAGTPFHSCAITSITGILRAGGDTGWAAALDLLPQWLVGIPLTALFALLIDGGSHYWLIAIAIQCDSIVKLPLCLWRTRKDVWIHDVTLPEGRK